jgi:hypothetical protein
MKRLSGIVVLFVGVSAAALGARPTPWEPPVGIPAPDFGIVEEGPAAPSPWVSPVPGFYYVDPTVGYATDLANPFGSPAQPRLTIPSPVPAGAVVELHGAYGAAHTSPRGVRANGTASAPVYIRGVEEKEKDKGKAKDGRVPVTGCWEISGTYFIVENLEFTGCGNIILLAPTDHGVLRGSDIHGTLEGGGVGVQSWNGQSVSNVVLFQNLIHDNGDVHADYDQDVHGIAVGAHVSFLWVLENALVRNSGDGIQINAGSGRLQATTHHVYVGRNTAHSNKQSGFWTKQAVDVIFSQNQSFNHRPSNSSMGACMGGQYSPEYVWYIANVVGQCDFGIQLASDDNGFGTQQFFIGNVIAQIHDTIGRFDPDNTWQNCGISLPGGTERYVIQNTLYDVDSGVCVANQFGLMHFYDNVIEQVRPDGFHLLFASQQVARASNRAQGNVFAPNFRMNVASTITDVAKEVLGGRGQNQVGPSVGFVNPQALDFHLKSSSIARGNGTMPRLGVWEKFEERYGVELDRDVYGTRRSRGSANSGAIE